MRATQALGFAGEKLVAEFLEKQGYTILAKNFRSSFGEIDVIAQKDEYLAFVEVKTRKVAHFPIASVITPGKQKKIIKTAKYYLMRQRGVIDKVCRFDVATVVYDPQVDLIHRENKYQIDYIENAFCAR